MQLSVAPGGNSGGRGVYRNGSSGMKILGGTIGAIPVKLPPRKRNYSEGIPEFQRNVRGKKDRH